MSLESGASALDARINPTIVEPQPVTAGFAELGCNLLAQTSRGHVLTGSGAKDGCCFPEFLAVSLGSCPLERVSMALEERAPAGRTAAQRRIRRVHGCGRWI